MAVFILIVVVDEFIVVSVAEFVPVFIVDVVEVVIVVEFVFFIRQNSQNSLCLSL